VKYASRVARHTQDGNQLLFRTVDRVLEGFAKGMKKKAKAKGEDKPDKDKKTKLAEA